MTPDAQEKRDVLPEDVMPKNYQLLFVPDLERQIFDGTAKIKVDVKTPTSSITLNSNGLAIRSPALNGKSAYMSVDQARQTITLSFDEPIQPGEAELSMDFRGSLEGKINGFYSANFTQDVSGKKVPKRWATTQFEAPYARMAFPCFDQPDMKATFDVEMRVPNGLKAISNMPAKARDSSDRSRFVFETTPKMSTYLLYLGVGEFDILKDQYRNIALSAITIPGRKEEGRFILDWAKKSLEYLEDYTKIAYPLPKMDLIAVPDFAAGAMENWGAITFRDIYGLVDPNTASTDILTKAAMVNAHEFTHQWFGNLVTMKWWDDLWLNEAFATFMGYKIVDHHEPGWNMWNGFMQVYHIPALQLDALPTTHAIATKNRTVQEAEEHFDKISYGKGGAVLRMLEDFIGVEAFKSGVREYLGKNQYGNATADDLWSAFADATGNKRIRDMLVCWVTQPGLPLVEVERDSGKLTLRQKRFAGKQDDESQWIIPLTIQTSDNQTIKVLLDKDIETITLEGSPQWVKVNGEQKGFYRTIYSPQMLADLKPAAAQKKLLAFDRWGIVNDLFNISLVGELPLTTYLDFVAGLTKEDDPLVLKDMLENAKKIDQIFSNKSEWSSVKQKLFTETRAPYKQQLERLGWEPKQGESKHDALLRPICIEYLVLAGDKDTIDRCNRAYEQSTATPLPADLRSVVYKAVAVNGDTTIQDQLIARYKSTPNPGEKQELLGALASFRSETELRKSFTFYLSEDVKMQEWGIAFGHLCNNHLVRSWLLEEVKANWETIEKCKETASIMSGVLVAIATAYVGAEKEHEVQAFYDETKPGQPIGQANAFAILKRNTNWLEKNCDRTVGYLSNKPE